MKLLIFICLFMTVLASPAADIVVARGQSRKSSPSQVEMDRQSNAVIRHFSNAGIDIAVIKDTEISAATLRGAKLVVLPYNAFLPDANYKPLAAAVKSGCRVLAFYLQDPRVAALLGLQPPAYVPSSKFGQPTRILFNETSLAGLPAMLPHAASVGCKLLPLTADSAESLGVFANSQNIPTGFHAAMRNASGIAFAHVFPTSDRPRATQLLLALCATAIPGIWEKPTSTLMSSMGVIGDCEHLASLRRHVQSRLPGPAAAPLALGEQHIAQTRECIAGRQFAQAYVHAIAARDAFRNAYLACCRPLHHELRGVWLHSAYGIRDWGWDKTIRVLKENGFNAIFANMLWGYVADYPSDVLPTHPNVATKGDQIKLCLQACRKYGVELHVWKVCWNMGHRTDPRLKEQMRKAQRTQVTYDGKVTDFLAPHLKENQDLETAAFLEIVRKYDVDGIHMDYIRYTDEDSDYSPSARQSFETFLGAKVADWPAACTIGGALRKQFNAWRRNNISRLVERVSREAHALRPGIKVSAAVYGGWDNSPHSVAQSPELWLEKNWLDFVCPMNYTPDTQFYRDLVERQNESVQARHPLYIGIGSYMIPDAPGIAEQIELSRSMGADGFICFSHNLNFANDMLPVLGKTVAAGQATPPFAHHSPSVTTHVGKSATPLLVDAFALQEPVVATLDFPPGWTPPPHTIARELLDGHIVSPPIPMDVTVDKNHVHCAFTPTHPGAYRIEITDDATFVTRSKSIPVLTPDQVRQRQTEERIPVFAFNGKPRIAVWQHQAYGEPDITQTLRQTNLYDVAPLYNLKPAALASCDAIVFPQPRKHPALFDNAENIAALRTFVANGGALMVTHALVGIRIFPIIFPEIVAEAKEPTLKTAIWQILPNAGNIVRGLPAQPQKSSFPDMVAMTPGPLGKPFLTEPASGCPVAIAGYYGKGSVVALGLGIGIGFQDKDCPLAPADRQLLLAIASWLVRK